jgi:protein-S-isoprenylcysteine O-methyltransferase Ste14
VFAVAITAMIAGLHEGMCFGFGRLDGAPAWLANGALALSFPLIHSWLLTARGGRLLDRVATGSLGRDLRTTSYALVASLQLLTVFALWSPTGEVIWRAEGAGRAASEMLFAASWLALGKAMWDAGLGVQTGFLGWGSVARGRAPEFRSFPTEGLFRFTRQPVYVAFTMTLWTGPVLTTDRLCLAVAWTLYCIGGPRLKERRMLTRDPERFRRYQARVPYWLPRWKPAELEP